MSSEERFSATEDLEQLCDRECVWDRVLVADDLEALFCEENETSYAPFPPKHQGSSSRWSQWSQASADPVKTSSHH